MQFFGWLLVQDRIQCRTNLLTKNIVEDATCELCHLEDEDSNHIVFSCPIARSFWSAIGVQLSPDASVQTLWDTRWSADTPQEHRACLALLCCWNLWKHRNAVVFRQEPQSLQRLLQTCREDARLWRHRIPTGGEEVASAWCNQLFSN